MIKVLVIDDEQHAINVIVDNLKGHNNYKLCGTAKSVEEAINLTHSLSPDLVFLDIVLGKKTAFDYLKAFLPNIKFNIIFVTAHNTYAVKAFEYSALHFLLKPIDSDKFKKALTRMNDKVGEEERLLRLESLEHNIKRTNRYKWMHISTIERKYKIHSKDILFIASDSNYSHIHLLDKTKITTSKTLKHYTNLLEDSHFYKVHKSYLVNTEYLKTYDRKKGILKMKDNQLITVAERRRSSFSKLFFSS